MQKERREGRKRLNIDVPTVFYERMINAIKKRNITLTKWLLRAILKELIEEEKYD